MPRLNNSSQIEALRRQQEEIAAKLKKATATERDKLKTDERRRSELAGRAVLDLLKDHSEDEIAKAFYAALDTAIKRPADRELFPMLSDRKTPPTSPDGPPPP